MSLLKTIASLIYLLSAVCYVIGVHMMRSPKTARNGNLLSGLGMAMAVVMILVEIISKGQITLIG